LENFRRILEGSKYVSTIKKNSTELEGIPEAITTFFQDMEVKIITEIDEFHKLIKYTFRDSEETDEKSYFMIVSYQILGAK